MDREDEHKSVDCETENLDDYSDGSASEYDEEEMIVDSDQEDFGGDHPEERYTDLIQQADITQVSNSLSIPRVYATELLRHYNWDVIKAQDEWFADEEKVRKDVGLLEQVEEEVPYRNTKNTTKCRNCLEEFPCDVMCAAQTCGHLFCNLCWTKYVNSDGPGSLMLGCPDPSCVVGGEKINKSVSDEDRKKYSRHFYCTYDEDKKRTKQCPRPGCEFAVEFVVGSSSYDVVCRCGHSFCWNCVQDAHRPVDCDTVHQWGLKKTAEFENVIWILANSKSCLKCRHPIEKTEGCLDMACRCGFVFCWLCLGDWSIHGQQTGGLTKCNIYEEAKAEGRYDEEEKIKKKAQDYLHRYNLYYKRFAEQEKSRQMASERLQKLQSTDLPKLSYTYALPYSHLECITDAWLQIIECRRVLKWSYAYGYFLPEHEKGKAAFLEYLQGEAESGLESLRRCAQVEFQTYLWEYYYAVPIENFKSFLVKLVDLTCITKRYFQNLVRSLENGLSEVQS